MLGGRALKCVIPGGISTKVLTGAEIEPLDARPRERRGGRLGLGSGGMVVIAEGTCMVRLLQVLLRFYHHESCGQCTPCREGMGWMHRIIDRIVAGEGRPDDIDRAVHDLARPTTARRSAAWATPPATRRSASSPSTATSSSTASRTAARVRLLEATRLSGSLPMPEIFINGQTGRGRRRPDRDAGGAASGYRHPVLLLAPGSFRSPATAASASSRSKATAAGWVEIACNMPVTEGMRVLTDSRARARAPQGDAAVPHAQPPGRLRHLRQGRRVHAAGLPLRIQRRAVGLARRQGARDQVPRAVEPHRARQRALHPVLALRALHARDLEVARARHPEPRRRARWCARPRTTRFDDDPYSDNVIDICPVGALLSRAVPAQGARLVPRADAVGLPGLRARLHASTSGTASRNGSSIALDPRAERAHRRA